MYDERPRVVSSVATDGGVGRPVLRLVMALALGVIVGLALASLGSEAPSEPADPPTSPSAEASARTEAGAVSALASAIEGYSLDVLVDRDEAEAVFTAMGTPAFVRDELSKWDRAARSGGGRVLAEAATAGEAFAQSVPLRIDVERYDGRLAVARLWTMTVLAGEGLSPSAQFSIDRARAVWDGGEWRVDSMAQVREGPTPGALQSELTRSSRSFASALAGLREVGDAD